jgi:hypothetical protein
LSIIVAPICWWHLRNMATRPDRLQFFCHINGIKPSIQFTMETEANNKFPFLDVHVIRKQSSIITTVNRKLTHPGRSLKFHSNLPPHVKRWIIRILYNRAIIICRERQDLAHEVKNMKHDLQLNCFPQKSSTQSSIIPEGKTG